MNCFVSPIHVLNSNRRQYQATKSRMGIIFFVLLSFLQVSVLAQKQLSFTDKIYEPTIKTVQLYPNLGGPQDFLQPSSAPINQQILLLEFDDLQDNRSNYYVKLIHCNFDWTQSQLTDLDYLENFNEFPFTDYNASANTQVHYIHYRFQVPPVKIPGNYLLIVYRDDIKNLMFSRRMMVFDTQISFTKDDQFIGAGTINTTLQPFNFVVDYKDVEIMNPTVSVHVNIRQNQRWDNVKMDVPSSFVRDDQNQLEYKSMDEARQFKGGSEFRYADFRSLNYPGVNTGRLIKTTKPYELFIQVDKPKGDDPYSQTKDNDGGYIIDNTDTGEPAINGNYLYVDFGLKTNAPYNGDVYVIGKFNDYQRSAENRMTYDSTDGMYKSQQFLKQGWYDYQYVIDAKKTSPYAIEGSHYETENTYEVAIYNHALQPNADLLLGYYIVQVNTRQ